MCAAPKRLILNWVKNNLLVALEYSRKPSMKNQSNNLTQTARMIRKDVAEKTINFSKFKKKTAKQKYCKIIPLYKENKLSQDNLTRILEVNEDRDKETPLSIYMVLLVEDETIGKTLEKLFDFFYILCITLKVNNVR